MLENYNGMGIGGGMNTIAARRRWLMVRTHVILGGTAFGLMVVLGSILWLLMFGRQLWH